MSPQLSIDELNNQFAIPNALAFETGGGGLACAVVQTGHAAARVYLQGAHVTDYQPAGHEPVIFTSAASGYGPGKAIRGGVPICFPWFGPHPTDKSAPSHGPARISAWELADVKHRDMGLTLRFGATFEPFAVSHEVTFGPDLRMTLSVRNTSQEAQTFEAAQHTYLTVGDIHNIEIKGLEGTDYLDKVDGHKRKNQGAAPVRFTGETDRVYLDTPSTCMLGDPGMARTITISKAGSESTVIWNPWSQKAKAMSDLGDDDWLRMVCIETANAGPNAVTVDPNRSHTMATTIAVQRL